MNDMFPSPMRALKARFLPAARQAAPRPAPQEDARREPAAVPPLRPRVEIPVCDPAPDAAAIIELRTRSRHLARQDRWDTLSDEIISSDRERLLTPGGRPIAPLLAEGARADAVRAARTGIARGEARAAQFAISALEVNLEDMPDCPGLSAVLALTHVDMARAWRGAAQLSDLASNRRVPFDAHLAAATELADRFDPFERDMPLWALVRCAVLDGDPQPAQRVADDYEDLIDLNPITPDHMVALGRELLPHRFGTWEAVDLQARRTAARTADIWGLGGYAWVWMGALAGDAGRMSRLDPELFTEALHDIMARHRGDQHMANRLAAFTGMTVAGSSAPGAARARVAESFGWIARDHLRELHPMVWAQAATPGAPGGSEIEKADAFIRGKARALSTIAQHFATEMGNGGRVVFDAEGVRVG